MRVQRCVQRCARHWQSRVLLARASAVAAAAGGEGGGVAMDGGARDGGEAGGGGGGRNAHGDRYAGIWEGVGAAGFGVYHYQRLLMQPLPPHLGMPDTGFYETWKLQCVPLPRR